MFIYSPKSQCVRKEAEIPLKNRDIIKVLVPWKRNEIFFPPVRRQSYEISNIGSFNVTAYSTSLLTRHDQEIKLIEE